MKHTGDWQFHEDDCLCGAYTDAWCNRGGWVWSCCGACAEESECTAPALHPTHWKHPRHHETVRTYVNGWPVHLSPAELRERLPELFPAQPTP